jgi:hypothetical protein
MGVSLCLISVGLPIIKLLCWTFRSISRISIALVVFSLKMVLSMAMVSNKV